MRIGVSAMTGREKCPLLAAKRMESKKNAVCVDTAF
jgi:hypothetical protein